MPLALPAPWVRAGIGIPAVCSRHGRVAAYQTEVVIESAAPAWTYALIPLGLLPFLVVRAATRKVVTAPAWPFCRRCGRRRVIAIMVATAIGACGLLSVLLYGELADRHDYRLLVAGTMLIIAGYCALHWARRTVIAGTRVTQDGYWVQVRSAAKAFEDEAVSATGGRDGYGVGETSSAAPAAGTGRTSPYR
jgi:hypothetical protein